MPDLSHERLLELLNYDPKTGIFTWRISRKKCTAGKRAGSQRADGYRVLTIDYDSHLEGRLAWFYMTGSWPKFEIDHRDLNPSNTKWKNLREATRSQNECNKMRRSDNSSGHKGVRQAKQKKGFEAYIHQDGKHVTLGTFLTKKEAARARKNAASGAYKEFARHA